MSNLSPDLLKALQSSQLDTLCLDCGRPSGYTALCGCGSRNVKHVTHAEQRGTGQSEYLCGNGIRPPRR